MKTPTYQLRTVQKFLDYLQEMGLSVYGQGMKLGTNVELPALMDYDASDITNRRKHYAKDNLVREEGC